PPSRFLLERDTQAGPHLDPGPIPGRGREARSPRRLERGLIDPDILADRLQHLNVLDAALLVDQDRQDDDALDPEFPGERRILRFRRADKFRRHRQAAVRTTRAGGRRAGPGAPGPRFPPPAPAADGRAPAPPAPSPGAGRPAGSAVRAAPSCGGAAAPDA